MDIETSILHLLQLRPDGVTVRLLHAHIHGRNQCVRRELQTLVGVGTVRLTDGRFYLVQEGAS